MEGRVSFSYDTHPQRNCLWLHFMSETKPGYEEETVLCNENMLTAFKNGTCIEE
jgi:hypothetical protein